MSNARLFVVAVLWATSLLGVGLWAQGDRGKVFTGVYLGKSDQEPVVISSDNIGFRRMTNPTGEKPGTISGRLVVRVNGVWLEAVAPSAVQLVPAR